MPLSAIVSWTSFHLKTFLLLLSKKLRPVSPTGLSCYPSIEDMTSQQLGVFTKAFCGVVALLMPGSTRMLRAETAVDDYYIYHQDPLFLTSFVPKLPFYMTPREVQIPDFLYHSNLICL